jgi:hypothetical protein
MNRQTDDPLFVAMKRSACRRSPMRPGGLQRCREIVAQAPSL